MVRSGSRVSSCRQDPNVGSVSCPIGQNPRIHLLGRLCSNKPVGLTPAADRRVSYVTREGFCLHAPGWKRQRLEIFEPLGPGEPRGSQKAGAAVVKKTSSPRRTLSAEPDLQHKVISVKKFAKFKHSRISRRSITGASRIPGDPEEPRRRQSYLPARSSATIQSVSVLKQDPINPIDYCPCSDALGVDGAIRSTFACRPRPGEIKRNGESLPSEFQRSRGRRWFPPGEDRLGGFLPRPAVDHQAPI